MPDLSYWGSDRIWTNPKEGGYQPGCALLRCPECGLRYWNTKNIGYIGARNLFRFKGGCDWMKEQFQEGPECPCTAKLVVDVELMEHVVDCEVCQKYGY